MEILEQPFCKLSLATVGFFVLFRLFLFVCVFDIFGQFLFFKEFRCLILFVFTKNFINDAGAHNIVTADLILSKANGLPLILFERKTYLSGRTPLELS